MLPARSHLRGIDYTLRTVAIAALVLLTDSVLPDVLLLIFAAALVACVLRGAANWLHDRIGLGTGWCLTLVLVVIFVVLAGGLWLQGPNITRQAADVADTVTQQVQHWWEVWQDNPLVQRLAPRIRDQAGSVIGHVT